MYTINNVKSSYFQISELLPTPLKYHQGDSMPSPEGRNYVAYIPVPINNEDEDDEDEYDDEYEDDEYYDDDEDEEYEDDDEYYEDDEEEVNSYSKLVYQYLQHNNNIPIQSQYDNGKFHF